MTYYKIEWLVPTEKSISGHHYWSELPMEGCPARFASTSEAQRHLPDLRAQGMTVRIVRVTEEEVQG